jgi:hypothetical protein
MVSVDPAEQEMRELDVLLRLGSLHTPMAVRVAATSVHGPLAELILAHTLTGKRG